MSSDYAVRWDIELAADTDVPLVTSVPTTVQTHLGIAFDLLDGVEEGKHRMAITHAGARDLYVALARVAPDREEDAARVDRGAEQDETPHSNETPLSAWGGARVASPAPARSEVHGVAPVLETVRVRRERSVVDEVNDRSDRDPHSLVSCVGIGIGDLAVELLLKLARQPETRRALVAELRELLGDEVEDVVSGADASSAEAGRSVVEAPGSRVGGVRSDHEPSHDASPSAGEGAEPGRASTLSVGGEPAAGGSFVESPAASPGRWINPAALRSIRELGGVRSGDLARAAGISHGYLSNIEAGRKQPSPSTTVRLARRLGVSVDAITQTV